MNNLAGEASPYLAQHADNPVHWHPWGEAALNLARTENRPILLSIGYSACHWCHVMAHESFEHEATAEVMNERFVNIKVDREERPDLDRAYQLAHHLLTRQGGGWPLTAFLDPETLLPFFTGTYFPRTPRHGLPGFVDVLIRISDAWGERMEDIREQGDKLRAVVKQLDGTKAESELADEALLATGREELGKLYDPQGGGFGNAPKFPMPGAVERLLRHWHLSRARGGPADREALDMVMTTLTKMARGGIFDHLGGGFCRYSTDREWMIPHFEKMLCDNGSLLALYADAMAVAPDALFEGALRDTADWMLREMQHPDGGYFAALDADSDGGEGRHYVWRRQEVGPFVFVAGTTAIEPSGRLHAPGDTYAQTLYTIARIEQALRSVHAELRHVTRTRAFLADMGTAGEYARAHGEMFAGVRPVATGVGADLATPG